MSQKTNGHSLNRECPVYVFRAAQRSVIWVCFRCARAVQNAAAEAPASAASAVVVVCASAPAGRSVADASVQAAGFVRRWPSVAWLAGALSLAALPTSDVPDPAVCTSCPAGPDISCPSQDFPCSEQSALAVECLSHGSALRRE